MGGRHRDSIPLVWGPLINAPKRSNWTRVRGIHKLRTTIGRKMAAPYRCLRVLRSLLLLGSKVDNVLSSIREDLLAKALRKRAEGVAHGKLHMPLDKNLEALQLEAKLQSS